jgi:transposase
VGQVYFGEVGHFYIGANSATPIFEILVSKEVGMTINHQTRVQMREGKSSADSGASQGARGATEDAPESARPEIARGSDSEVVPRARRRTFSNAEKRRILQEADRCTQPGEIGALMRREGVYSSSLSTWRRQREAADLAALAPQKRGPKANASRADALQIAPLTRERDKLRVELEKAQLVIEVQKKVTALLDLLETDNKRGNT